MFKLSTSHHLPWFISVSFIICSLISLTMAVATNEAEERSRLMKWAEKEGLIEPTLNEEGLPILEVERIDFKKLKIYNKHCGDSDVKRSMEKKMECQQLGSEVVKSLDDMSLDELTDYFNKRKKAKDEL